MHHTNLKDSVDGIRIYPSDFPEVEFFTIRVEEYRK